MNKADKEFLHDMVKQLEESIRQLAVEQARLIDKIGAVRVEELLEYWRLELSADEEMEFKKTMDHWDIQLIRLLSRSKRAQNTRAEVGRTLMKMASRPILKRKSS